MCCKQFKIIGIAFICILLNSFSCWASERDCLILQLQSGENLVFLLNDEPQFLFSEKGVEIGLHDLTISEVVKYTFGDSETYLAALPNAVLQDAVSLHEGMLLVSLTGNNSLHIFTTTGQEIMYHPLWQQDNKIMIDLNFLPTGIYVISTGTEKLKILKK